MQNTEIYVKYRNNQPVPVETAYGRGPTGHLPLTTVAHLIAAFQQLPNSPLASAFVGDLTLHLPEGALAGNCLLASLPSHIGTYNNPLVICVSKEKLKLIEDEERLKFESEENRELLTLLIRQSLIDAPTTVTARKKGFKKDLMAAYKCDSANGMARCMLLNTALPSSLVIGAHLFRRSNELVGKKLLDIGDIDDTRNGLLLFKPLEDAFDRFNISFIYDAPSDEYRLKVFNPFFLKKTLVELLSQDKLKILLGGSTLPPNWLSSTVPIFAPDTTFNILTSFGELEGRSIVFLNMHRPFKRCLNLQAKLARHEAVRKGWVPKDYDFDDFSSEGPSVAEKMDRYFLGIEESD